MYKTFRNLTENLEEAGQEAFYLETCSRAIEGMTVTTGKSDQKLISSMNLTKETLFTRGLANYLLLCDF